MQIRFKMMLELKGVKIISLIRWMWWMWWSHCNNWIYNLLSVSSKTHRDAFFSMFHRDLWLYFPQINQNAKWFHPSKANRWRLRPSPPWDVPLPRAIPHARGLSTCASRLALVFRCRSGQTFSRNIRAHFSPNPVFHRRRIGWEILR